MNMPILTQFGNSEQKTMSSRVIADLTEKRHDHVKRDVENMLGQLGLDIPKFGGIYFDAQNRQQTEYLLDEELTMTLVTGYNIVLRNRVIKRWKELESQIAQPVMDLNNPEFLRQALLGYTEKVIELTTKNQTLTKAIENITATENGVKFQQACKILNVKQADLAKWLRDKGWDRYINKSRASTHYSQERGYCETKFEEVDGVKPSGEPYNYTKIEFFILPKGMAVLAKHFGVAA